MFFFNNRKPRGFHHTYIYADSRRELLQRLRERAASSSSSSSATKTECDRDMIHRAFRRPVRRGQWSLVRGMFMPVVLLLVLVFLLLLILEK